MIIKRGCYCKLFRSLVLCVLTALLLLGCAQKNVVVKKSEQFPEKKEIIWPFAGNKSFGN